MGEIGKYVAGSIGAVVVWNSLSPGTKQSIKEFVGELFTEIERQRRIKEANATLESLQAPEVPDISALDLVKRSGDTGFEPIQGLQPSVFPPPELLPKIESDGEWRELIQHPSIVVILGKRGSGKSSLGYRLLEIFRTNRTPYAVGVTKDAVGKLPEWIGVAESLDDVPTGSVALIDEAYIHFHARNSQTRSNKDLSQTLNLSRQRDITLLFVTQESRQIDKNIVSVANVIVFKEPAALQVEFERPEVRKIAEKAVKEFATVIGDRREWSYLFAPESDHAGMIRNALPTFWSPGLSKAFAKTNSTPGKPRSGKKMPIPERRKIVRQKKADGWSSNQIAKFIGVSKATIIGDLKEII